MALRYWSQEVMAVAMPSPVSPPTQREQTAEQDYERSDDASDDRTNGGPPEPR